MYDNSNDSNNSSGNKGKFSERLKKIRRDKLKKDTIIEDDSVLKNTGRNIFKVILSLPVVVYTNVVHGNKKNDKKKIIVEDVKLEEELKKNEDKLNEDKLEENLDSINTINQTVTNSKTIKVNKIKDINFSILKKNVNEIDRNSFINDVINDVVDNNDITLSKEKLQKEIINLIKKKLVKNINELEMLQSDFFVMKELKCDEVYLKECIENIKEIKKLLSRVNSLKEKYNYLKDNIDFEYMLEYEDDLLLDKILELKDICLKDDVKKLVDDYKILDEFKFLYLKIDKLEEDTVKFQENKETKEKELKQRDIDFDEFKNKLYDIDIQKDNYYNFIKNQEHIIQDLDKKIRNIDSHEVVSYKMKGFNQLLGNSFKYLGLLLMNPLKGLLPGIVTQTVITKNIIHNLYNNLELEENRKMVYEAIDYSVSLDAAMSNLNDISSMVDYTLEEIVKLKSKYEKEFSKYSSSFVSYSDSIKKLNKMENAILNTKVKIDLMQIKVKEQEKANSNKLNMVKKLNSSNNN